MTTLAIIFGALALALLIVIILLFRSIRRDIQAEQEEDAARIKAILDKVERSRGAVGQHDARQQMPTANPNDTGHRP